MTDTLAAWSLATFAILFFVLVYISYRNWQQSKKGMFPNSVAQLWHLILIIFYSAAGAYMVWMAVGFLTGARHVVKF
jgi:hypothetical protein